MWTGKNRHVMQPAIYEYDQEKEYFFREGCFINELSNQSEDEALSIARARVRPGEGTHWHRLRDRVERYVILQGVGAVHIGNMTPQDVSAGDVVFIPAGCPQKIFNRGEIDLVFLALCTPRFVADCYIDMRDER